MADLLHTADVHLDADIPARIEALSTVLDDAASRGVAAVTIGGDLFDDPDSVDTLRPRLRSELFADREFEIVVIPGNHDAAGFRGDTFFGAACTALVTEPFSHHEIPAIECRITGVPFVGQPNEDFILDLADREPYPGTEVLLIHCTLDAGLAQAATGAEAAHRYCPITAAEVAELDFDYILAGHFHDARQEQLSSGTFVYPGTPVSTRSSETGRRHTAVVDVDAGTVDFEPLETFHYVAQQFDVLPGEERALFERVEEWVATNARASAEATVRVDGFHELDEAAFHDRLQTATGPASVEDRTVTARRLQAHPVYRAFADRLSETDWDAETRAAVRRRTLRAMNTVRGEL